MLEAIGYQMDQSILQRNERTMTKSLCFHIQPQQSHEGICSYSYPTTRKTTYRGTSKCHKSHLVEALNILRHIPSVPCKTYVTKAFKGTIKCHDIENNSDI